MYYVHKTYTHKWLIIENFISFCTLISCGLEQEIIFKMLPCILLVVVNIRVFHFLFCCLSLNDWHTVQKRYFFSTKHNQNSICSFQHHDVLEDHVKCSRDHLTHKTKKEHYTQNMIKTCIIVVKQMNVFFFRTTELNNHIV